ncbi:Protein of unknown function [Granulicella rosea]|uniref:DUF721 domain-containing protein n=1 Tax=Granulicella rosea TaxID=474952 RepID=A0A239CVQ0_9BACT|nr:DciA family protein [Granulicella rosea]SNS23614.1 Protein of unknown function [Granulicella rosea]
MDSMRDILKQQLGRSLRSMPDLDRLAAAWPVACGRAMAERGQVVGFTDGVIQVAVSDVTWLKQMISMHGTLERELARIAGVKSAGIHFELKK